jgi:hypothetical protein
MDFGLKDLAGGYTVKWKDTLRFLYSKWEIPR